MYIVFELFIYLLWIYLFVSRILDKSRSSFEELFILIFTLPIAVIIELINEFYFSDTGLFYSASLLFFGGFKFTVAVIFYNSLFAWLMYYLSAKIMKLSRIYGKRHSSSIQFMILIFLIPTCWLFEFVAFKIDYVDYGSIVFPDIKLMVLAGMYITYSLLSIPSFIFAKMFSHLKSRF